MRVESGRDEGAPEAVILEETFTLGNSVYFFTTWQMQNGHMLDTNPNLEV
jgi:hypothetical protein